MKKLENKIVFITGSNSGIGKASALEAAREGATIVVADLEKTNHKQTKRLCTPEEVANAFVYLASNDSSYCNGTQLIPDGGVMA